MENFNKDDYAMPEDAPKAPEKVENKAEKAPIAEKSIEERMQEELKQAELFLATIDKSSHKDEVKNEEDYTEKLMEIAKEAENTDISKELENKIYFQNIKNLIEHQNNTLNAVSLKIEKIGTEDYSFKKMLEEKADEISQRKAILERHLYDLKNYIKEDIES